MIRPCAVGGVEMPLGLDDVRDFLEQYGEVRRRAGTSVLDLLPDPPEWPGLGRVSAYALSNRWRFFASASGAEFREFFDDLADAVAYACPGEGVAS